MKNKESDDAVKIRDFISEILRNLDTNRIKQTSLDGKDRRAPTRTERDPCSRSCAKVIDLNAWKRRREP